MALEDTAYHMNNYDPGHTRLNQEFEKNMKINFGSPPKNSSRKNEKGSLCYGRYNDFKLSWDLPRPREQSVM